MSANKEILCEEKIQAGDVFLLRFNCVLCQHDQLSAYPLEKCLGCDQDISNYGIKIKKSRLLSGSRRKNKIKKSVIQRLLIIQDRTCAYCDTSFSETAFNVEHITPLCVGGTNDPNNLCLSCPSCNNIAGSRVFNSFSAKKNYILTRKNNKLGPT